MQESKSWNDNNTLTKLNEAVSINGKTFDLDYNKLHNFKNNNKIKSVHANAVKPGDRIIAFNGMNFEGIITINKIEVVDTYSDHTEYEIIGKNPHGVSNMFTSGYVYKIVDDSIDFKDLVCSQKVISGKVYYKDKYLCAFKTIVDPDFNEDELKIEIKEN